MAGESIRFNASLNTAGFDSGAARLQQIAATTSGKVSASFVSMGAKIASVIAPFVGLYATINSVKNALDLGGRLNDLSKTTGETAGNLAILERAFANAGVGSEKLGPALAAVANFVTDLSNKMPGAEMAARALKIGFEDLAGKSPIEQMRILLAAISEIHDPSVRAALAMDVFKKAGRDIVPLAKDFSSELANARGELGSLPRILTENATSLDDLGDKLTNSVGNKLTELVVGLAAGATGADNFVAALSKIDAAGFGERIGGALRSAFAAPLEVLQGAGHILIAGVLEAGNSLKAAFQYAVNVYYEMMQNPGFYDGLRVYLEAMFAKVGEGFINGIVVSMKSLFGLMDWNPLWRPFLNLARAGLDEIQNKVTEAGESAIVWMEQGALQMKAAFNGAVKDSKYIYEDSLGAADHYKTGLEHFKNARTVAAQISAETARTEDSLIAGSKALTDAYNSIRGFDLGATTPGNANKANSMLSSNPYDKPDFFTSDNPPPVSSDIAKSPSTGGAQSRFIDAPLTFNERVAEMLGKNRQERLNNFARRYEAAGNFSAAVRAQIRGEKEFERTMTNARVKDLIASEYGAKNIGEAFSKYQQSTRIAGRMSESEFRKMLQERAKTPGQRQLEAEMDSQGRPSRSSADQSKNLATESTLKRILQKIQERPILVA